MRLDILPIIPMQITNNPSEEEKKAKTKLCSLVIERGEKKKIQQKVKLKK